MAAKLALTAKFLVRAIPAGTLVSIGIQQDDQRVNHKRDLVIAADFGTSGVKAGVLDKDFRLIASANCSYPLNLPARGYAEQDPQDWWAGLKDAIACMDKQTGGLRERAAGMVFCGQMCGVVCTGEDGEPVRPCLIWLDKRSADLTRSLAGGLPSIRGYGVFKLLKWLYLANGAPSLTGMDPPGKMCWIRQHEPENWQRTHKVLDAKDWLVHRATGEFVTTADCANLTWMMDTRPGRHQWSERLISTFGLERSKLPDIADGTATAGGLTAEAADELGLPSGLPVLAGCGDVCATAIGSGAIADGQLHIYMGTSSWIGGFFPDRRISVMESYATISSAVDKRPLLIASQETAGECFNWVARVAGQDTLDEIMEQAAAADTKQPALFLPWLAGERVPADDSDLRGAFLGLSLRDDSLSVVRAVLEGVALNTRWAFQSVARQRGVDMSGALMLTGGAAMNRGVCQVLSDCLQHPLCVHSDPQWAGVKGAAAIAFAGLGWDSTAWQAASRLGSSGLKVFQPDTERATYYSGRYDAFVDAYKRTAPWFRHVAKTSRDAASNEDGS